MDDDLTLLMGCDTCGSGLHVGPAIQVNPATGRTQLAVICRWCHARAARWTQLGDYA
jgi:hypothetical protein